MIAPRVSDAIGLREAALIALGVGCTLLGLTGAFLAMFGVPRTYARTMSEAESTSQGRLA
jgi:hypothetical protein